jgi:hypothetical protein
MGNGLMKRLIFLLHMPRGTITSYTDKTISFVEMDMAKKICKSKFQQEVGGPQPQ